MPNAELLSTINWDHSSRLVHVLELNPEFARVNEIVVSAININFFHVAQLPLPANLNLRVRINNVDPGVPVIQAKCYTVRNLQLDISHNALGPGVAPIILVFSTNPFAFFVQA